MRWTECATSKKRVRIECIFIVRRQEQKVSVQRHESGTNIKTDRILIQ
jgi:hypothetical protein